jgi:hypothetical protein
MPTAGALSSTGAGSGKTSKVPNQVNPGDYVTASIKTCPWLTTPVSQTSSKTKRSKNNKTLINPIFASCAEISTDPFWTSLFNSAAYGKFSRGFMYKDGILTYKRGNKFHQLEVPESPRKAYHLCVNFFSKVAGIMSQTDQEKARRELEEQSRDVPSLYSCTWADVKKKKKIKDMLIFMYIEELVKRYQLDEKQRLQLRSMINFGFNFGYFGNSNVVFENGRIEEIKGLQFNEETRLFFIDSSCVPKPSKPSKKSTKNEDVSTSFSLEDNEISPQTNFMAQWKKYLDALEKKMKMRSSSLSRSPEKSERGTRVAGRKTLTSTGEEMTPSTATLAQLSKDDDITPYPFDELSCSTPYSRS